MVLKASFPGSFFRREGRSYSGMERELGGWREARLAGGKGKGGGSKKKTET